MSHKHSKDTRYRLVRRQVFITCDCPSCGAKPGERCIKKNGSERFASHEARWNKYRATGV